MKLPRWLVGAMLSLSSLAALVAVGWWWVTWPTRTAQTFLDGVASRRFAAVRPIVADPEDFFGLADVLYRLGHIDDEWQQQNLKSEPRAWLDRLSARQRFFLGDGYFSFWVERGKVTKNRINGGYAIAVDEDRTPFWLDTPEVEAKLKDLTRGEREAVLDLWRLGARLKFEASNVVSVDFHGGMNSRRIVDADLKHIGRLVRLKELSLSHTQVGNDGLACLGGLQDLEGLWLTGTRVTDEGLAHVGKLPSLRTLYIDELPITDAGLVHLQSLQKPFSLALNGTKVTDAGLGHLRRLPVRWLWLRNTQVSDAGMRHLGELDLVYVALSDTNVTDAGLEHLKSCHHLHKIWLGGSNVTEAGVSKLRQELPECEIEW